MKGRTSSGQPITVKPFTVQRFAGKLRTVREREGQCVKMTYG